MLTKESKNQRIKAVAELHNLTENYTVEFCKDKVNALCERLPGHFNK